MSTSIEWTHIPGYRGDVWNPTTGCNKVSQGCKHCYAEVMHRRLQAMGVKGYEQPFLAGARPVAERLQKPLKAKKPTAYFVNSMSDLFHEAVPFWYIDQVFAVMALCPQHLFLILTKRPERMAEYFSTRDRFAAIPPEAVKPFGDEWVANGRVNITEHRHPLPNVWLGTSVEDQATADARIPHLLRCAAAVKFLSCEPLLAPVDIDRYEDWLCTDPLCAHRPGIGWVIAGGESGAGARPMHPNWVRRLRDQCQAAGVPFFFKQWGAWLPVSAIDAAVNYPSERTMLFSEVTGKPYMGVKSLTDTGQHMARMPKHASGNLLDGRTQLEWPKVITEEPASPCV